MRLPVRFLTPLALLATFAGAADAAPTPIAAAMHALDDAVTRADGEAMLAARGGFSALLADAPNSPHALYGLALADWRVVPMQDSTHAAQARKLCREGIEACDRALAADPKFADAVVLKAALQGLAIGLVPSTGMTLGPEIVEASARAHAMAPGNPRVTLLVAILTLHMPASQHGGAAAARPLFERAVALYEAAGDPAGDELAWGRPDAYLWSGQCLAALGDWAGARDAYRKVLELRPDHVWTKRVLLPRVEAKLAAGGAR